MKSKQDSVVHSSEPRQTAQVRFPDGRVFEAPVGTSVEEYVHAALPDSPVPVIAALVNGELRELNYTMRGDGRIDPVLLSDSDGVRIYRRSLAFLLMTAVRELFPEAHVFVEYSLPFGGFFCQVRGREPFSVKELAQLETHMRRIVAEDAPITKERVPLDQAIELFNDRDEPDKARLLPRRKKDYLVLYNLAFILPLAVVFGLAYVGTTSEQLSVFARRHTATVKLGTVVLFVVLGGWLVRRLL